MPDLPDLAILFQRFGIALGVGLMLGVEREREKGTFRQLAISSHQRPLFPEGEGVSVHYVPGSVRREVIGSVRVPPRKLDTGFLVRPGEDLS